MTYSEIIEDLEQIKTALSSIKPVKIEGRVQWTGLIGIVQDVWKNRKFRKLCKTPIVGDTDYINLPLYLISKAKDLEEHLGGTNNVTESALAVALILECLGIWTNICPEVGYYTVNDEIGNLGKGKALPMILVIKHYLYSTFIGYNLDDKLKRETESNIWYIDSQIDKIINPQENNSGCLSILLVIAVPLSALYILF